MVKNWHARFHADRQTDITTTWIKAFKKGTTV